MKKVSIIIPVYNVEKYLPECLDSLLKQTYSEWEAVLVDDGSTDKSGEICEMYALKDSRFYVIHKKNGGAANAKNTAIDYATGDYICFVDSDDYVESKWLERVMEIVADYNADIVEFNFDKVFCTGTKQTKYFVENIMEFTAEQYLAQYLDRWTNSLFWNKLFSAELVKKFKFRKERRCIDDEFFTYKVVTCAHKIICINDILYHYRQRKSSAVQSQINQRKITDDALEVLLERYEWICKYFPNLRKNYLCHDVNIMFYFARFSHTKQTIKKFRHISRYYLYQTLRHGPYSRQLKNVIKLQMISKKMLMNEKEKEYKEEDTDLYFE